MWILCELLGRPVKLTTQRILSRQLKIEEEASCFRDRARLVAQVVNQDSRYHEKEQYITRYHEKEQYITIILDNIKQIPKKLTLDLNWMVRQEIGPNYK